jgi:uncharacterized protein (DUF433 family)
MALEAKSPADLIERYIEENPQHRGAADVRLIEHAVPVWALIGHYQATGRDAEYVAQSYRVPLEAVHAALAYYRQNRAVIDARLDANSA